MQADFSCLDNGIYTEEELQQLDRQRVPKHVALIMDGNRRWARKNKLPTLVGHWRGAETLTEIVRSATAIGIKVLTVYAFSTENWHRSSIEVEVLMRLLRSYLKRKCMTMMKEGVRVKVIGNLARLPFDVRAAIDDVIEQTANGTKIELILAISYGGRDEICRAIGKIVADCQMGKLIKEELSEQVVSRYLDTADLCDPELLIRTSGESRVSNFLLWQISYAEVYISKVLWPDFSPQDFLEAVLEYQRRELRRGK